MVMERTGICPPELSRLVIYHANCKDGFGAAMVAKKALPEQKTKFWSTGYHKEPPYEKIDENTIVFIVDFMYPLAWTKEIIKRAKKVIIIDHHINDMTTEVLEYMAGVTDSSTYSDFHSLNETDIDYNCKSPAVLFGLSNGWSGAALTYAFFYKLSIDRMTEKDIPSWVYHISDRDTWQFKNPNTRAFHEFLEGIPSTFDAWNNFINEFETSRTAYNSALSVGLSALNYVSSFIDALVKHCVYTMHIETVDGDGKPYTAKTCFINIHPKFASIFSERMYSEYEYDVVVTYSFNPNEDGFAVSLRSNSNSKISIDCRPIAKKYFNGNGHVHASGGKMKLTDLEYIIQNAKTEIPNSRV